jgi:hypothetical protein
LFRSILESLKPKKLDCIYLHIGFHKTGSSFIQQTLYRNKALLEKNDVSLICLSNYKRDMDKGNAAYLLRRLPRLKKKLNKSKSTAIISSEDMSWWSAEKITALSTLLAKYSDQVKVIAYLRNHDDYAVSMKQQGAKAHHIGKIFGHSEGLLPPVTDGVAELVNYHNGLYRWGDAFGRDNISITTFDFLKKNNIELIDNFLTKVNLSELAIERIEKANESIDFYWQTFLHKHQDLLWANKLVRNALLPELIELGATSNKKKLSVSESENFRALFQKDIDALQVFDTSEVLLNFYKAQESEFHFEEGKYKAVEQAFIELQSKVAKELYQSKTISEKELCDVITGILKVSKDSAKQLAASCEGALVRKLESSAM